MLLSPNDAAVRKKDGWLTLETRTPAQNNQERSLERALRWLAS